MAQLGSQLKLERCPHCNVDRPTLKNLAEYKTTAFDGSRPRTWHFYSCARCGGVVTAASESPDKIVSEVYPPGVEVNESIPSRAREYLKQAMNSLHAPAGAMMLAASSVDAMLKEKGYLQGNLYSRINQAVEAHLITEEMANWAHEVRLEANEQRHADEEAPLPNNTDAQRCIEFVVALGEFLFVLPARIDRGIEEATRIS